MATYSIAASCRARDVEAAGSKAYTLVQRTSLWHYLAALAVAIGWVACSCSIIMLVRNFFTAWPLRIAFEANQQLHQSLITCFACMPSTLMSVYSKRDKHFCFLERRCIYQAA
eukprot:1152582-Pelagomonas_calceolata.AAC.7